MRMIDDMTAFIRGCFSREFSFTYWENAWNPEKCIKMEPFACPAMAETLLLPFVGNKKVTIT